MRRRRSRYRTRDSIRKDPAAVSLTDRLTVDCVLSAWTGEAGNCRWCNKEITRPNRRTWCGDSCRRKYERNHVWTRARSAARRRANRRCVTCGSSEKLEVNHIVPLVGSGYLASCFHHEGNLELLCHDCHVKVTKQQRADRKQAKEDAAASELPE